MIRKKILNIDILGIAEGKLRDIDMVNIRKLMGQMEYYQYYTKGPLRIDGTPGGGIGLWIKKRLFQRIRKEHGGSAQLLMVEAGGWHICVGYAPPGKKSDMGKVIREFQTEIGK